MITQEEFVDILIQKKVKRIIIDKVISKKNKTFYAKGNIKRISEIIDILRKHDISDIAIFSCLSVLFVGNIWNMKGILKVLKKQKISKEAIENCLYVLAKGDADEIEKIFAVLKKHKISKNSIEQCLLVLAHGKAISIEKNLELLENHKISKASIEQCLTVLVKRKANEIEKIFEVLENHKISKSSIEQCLTVLARGKASEIEKIFKVLDKYNISRESIKNCLSVLARGKANEIEKNLKVFYEYNINNDVIEQHLTVLYRKKANEIETILKILRENNVSGEYIELYFNQIFFSTSNEIEKIFGVVKPDTKINRDYSFKDIKRYIMFNGKYNCYYISEDLDSLCIKLGISQELFLTEVIGISDYFVEYYKQALKANNIIWLGGSVSMTKEQMEENKIFIIEMVEKIGKIISSRYLFNDIYIDRADIDDAILDILINNCGDIFTNLINEELREQCLFRKIFKTLKGKKLSTNNYNVENFLNTQISSYNDEYFVNTSLNYKFLTKEENYMLNVLSYYLERGYNDFYEKSAEELDIPLDDFNDSIEKIKVKIKTNGIY